RRLRPRGSSSIGRRRRSLARRRDDLASRIASRRRRHRLRAPMAKGARSFLLEQLRAQADAIAAKRVQQLKLSREVVDRIDQRMHAVFQYFDEACKLLQVISPPIEIGSTD